MDMFVCDAVLWVDAHIHDAVGVMVMQLGCDAVLWVDKYRKISRSRAFRVYAPEQGSE